MSSPEARGSNKKYLVESEEDMWRTMSYMLVKFQLSMSQLVAITDRMRRDLRFGLRKKTNPKATIKMLPSYVKKIGCDPFTEKKTFLALDLGGTNFRVLLVEVSPAGIDPSTGMQKTNCKMDSKIYKVPANLMSEHGDRLFDHIAHCIADFIKIKKVKIAKGTKLPIGFTFSFPCRQTDIDCSTLLTWTKGFSCPGVEGENIGELLNQAINRNEDLKNSTTFKVEVGAIINDTVGTLMSCVMEDPDCAIGLIVGTGSNACYIEKTDKIETISDEVKASSKEMIINCEWGNFGSNGVLFDIQSIFDAMIDEQSPNPGKQIYEKMISGMYLGELVRLILIKLHDVGVVFYDEPIDSMRQKGAFETALVSNILNCENDDIMEIQNLIAMHLGVSIESFIIVFFRLVFFRCVLKILINHVSLIPRSAPSSTIVKSSTASALSYPNEPPCSAPAESLLSVTTSPHPMTELKTVKSPHQSIPREQSVKTTPPISSKKAKQALPVNKNHVQLSKSMSNNTLLILIAIQMNNQLRILEILKSVVSLLKISLA